MKQGKLAGDLKPPFLKIQHDVAVIGVEPGEVLTVWLGSLLSGEAPRTQIEIRCLPDGTRELYCDDLSVVRSFKGWYAEDTDE